MKLTWKDGVTTVTMALVTVAYLVFLLGADLPMLNSVRGTAATILILGFVGGCAFSGITGEQQQTGWSRFLFGLSSVFGVVAVVAGITALINASELALAVLFGATAALWLLATVRHAFAVREPTREVAAPPKPAHR